MKLISLTILLIALISASFSQLLMIACFDLNENFVAKEYCVNKNIPSSHCNGHCYLNKQLNNEEKPGNPLNASLKEKFEVQLFYVEGSDKIIVPPKITSTLSSLFQNFSVQEFLKNTFRPPRMA
jgi:hypothetical protein